MIQLPRRIQLEGLPGVMAKLDYAGSGSIELDFSAVEAVEGHAGPVLSAALLGTFGTADAVIRPPASADLLARTGIAFALVNRPGKTWVSGEEAAKLWPKWRESWVPADKETYGALFSLEDFGASPDVPNLIGRRYAAFVNAHLSRPSGEQHKVVNLLHPWLRELLPDRLGESFLDQLGDAITALVDNVRRHAPIALTQQPSKSLVHVWYTSGHQDHLYVTVIDNGPGIVTTARPKVIGHERYSDGQILQGLLENQLPRFNLVRGYGLFEVWKFLHSRQASLWISTAEQFLALEDGNWNLNRVAIGVDGTVVTLGFALDA